MAKEEEEHQEETGATFQFTVEEEKGKENQFIRIGIIVGRAVNGINIIQPWRKQIEFKKKYCRRWDGINQKTSLLLKQLSNVQRIECH